MSSFKFSLVDNLKSLKSLPDAPGVYLFKRGQEVLYIGKAASLRERVRSYFTETAGDRRPLIAKMRERADAVSYFPTDSILEALILEAREIKRHQPRYNIEGKDDKSLWYVVITSEDWPRVILVRGRDLKDQRPQVVYGPFPVAQEIKAGLKIIRKTFPFRDACAPGRGRLCLNAELGLCPGICAGRIKIADYRRTIRRIKLFFEARKGQLIRQLEREMKRAAGRLAFERAEEARRRIFTLTHIQEAALLQESVLAPFVSGEESSSVRRLEAYDVAHLRGGGAVGAMVVWEAGALKPRDYRLFKLQGEDDGRSLATMLERRFNHPEWPLPQAIVVDGAKIQLNIARRVLAGRGFKIPVAAVVKDRGHRPREILGAESDLRRLERPILLLNQTAHRFALKAHRRWRRRMLY